jgi:hypothetical protein
LVAERACRPDVEFLPPPEDAALLPSKPAEEEVREEVRVR